MVLFDLEDEPDESQEKHQTSACDEREVHAVGEGLDDAGCDSYRIDARVRLDVRKALGDQQGQDIGPVGEAEDVVACGGEDLEDLSVYLAGDDHGENGRTYGGTYGAEQVDLGCGHTHLGFRGAVLDTDHDDGHHAAQHAPTKGFSFQINIGFISCKGTTKRLEIQKFFGFPLV